MERIIGGPVVEAVSQTGGFSPGTADRVRTADGRRAFVKAVAASLNTDSVRMARRELRINAAMPAHAPVPRLLGGFEHGEWVVIVLEDIAGSHPRTPWVAAEIDATVTALGELARALTPAPLSDLPTAADHLTADFACWAALAADPPADLDAWAARNAGSLHAAAQRGLAVLRTGDTLVNMDVRADNILIREDGRIFFVDWPWGATAPAWFDRLALAINVIVHGGDARRITAGIDPAVVRDIITGFTGYFHYQSRQPPPPGLPTVRAFQRFQGDALLPWVQRAFSERTP
ncbi:phosphotransferase [Actinoplanes sp. NBRC 101535]|uniref:phosphotransferase n=1 Tax=Actinoplanes sp. NBRC 101535 TaxID=3032196 RepID=UPI0025574760|nr:phosphotransferase [Actinoplanes sp. NBRC 101535]